MHAVLLVDIGSTYTKVTAVDIESECIMGTAKAFTTVQTNIYEGLLDAINSLHSQIGTQNYSEMYACSSAAGGLKMVAIGLVPDLTAEAAKRAALCAGAKVMKTFSYELSELEADMIQRLKPDIVLLSGGTNGGNKEVIHHNAEVLSKIEGDFPVVVAGNKSVASKVEAILVGAGKEVKLCENVMPEFNTLNIEPARAVIRDIFLQRIIRAKGLTKVQEFVSGILMPTPAAVLNAVSLLSTGCKEEEGIGDLVAVDVGGATTDVYSICDGRPSNSNTVMKGLPEPYAKRTVEGDLGVRYSSVPLVEVAGIENLAKISGLTQEDIEGSLQMIKENPDILPKDDIKISKLDFGLTSIAIKLAVERHAGRIGTNYTPFGVVYVQEGKDLTGVKKIVGTGGPVINSSSPGAVLHEAMFDESTPAVLKPQKTQMFLDKKYILAAMGLLGEKYPQVAVRIMKKELEMIVWG